MAYEAVVIHCIDPRVAVPHAEFLFDQLGMARGSYYTISNAGSSKGFNDVSPEVRRFMVEQVMLALRHSQPLVVICHHGDCAGYGRSHCRPTKEAETAMHWEEMESAAGKIFGDCCSADIPVTIRLVYLPLEGDELGHPEQKIFAKDGVRQEVLQTIAR